MNEELLNRIAVALEGINSSLEEITASLDSLSECVSYAKDEGKRLCITGDITAYNLN